MFAKYLVIAAASVLSATAVAAQTHGQLLESAVFAEDTVGDTAAAIRIYERLVNTPSVPSEIATRARIRLANAQQPRTQTGLPGQINPPPPAPPAPQAPSGRGGRGGGRGDGAQGTGDFAKFFDATKPVTVIGNVTEIQWSEPHVLIFLRDNEGKSWGLELGPPQNLERSGWTRDVLKVGEQVQAQGVLARGVGTNCPFDPLPNGCATFPNGAIHINARSVLKTDGNGNLLRPGGIGAGGGGQGGLGGRGGRRSGGPAGQ